MQNSDIEPVGTYRPQYRSRWRGLVRVLDRFPRFKTGVAGLVRSLLLRVFEPGMVTTERVVEYPFVYQHLRAVAGPVLDIGSVHSRLPIALASRGHRVVGLDFLPYSYRHPNLWVVRADAIRCPFAAGTFDAVLAVSAVEHIGLGHYGDPAGGGGDRETVREIARILRQGGRALLTVPYGRAFTDDSMRVYNATRLCELLAPLSVLALEFAWSRQGLWMPCSETEAASVDWSGPTRAVALIVATTSGSPEGTG